MRFRVGSTPGNTSYQRWFAWRPVKVLSYKGGTPIVKWVWWKWLDRCLYHRAIDDLGIRPKHCTYSLIGE